MTEESLNKASHSLGDNQGEAGKLYLKGRYKKLQRGISQTPFALPSGEMLAEKSVEGILLNSMKSVISGESFKFIPAGREDLDVRMLGAGRPFAIEIKHPTKPNLTKSNSKPLSFFDIFFSDELAFLNNDLSDSSKGVVALDVTLAKRSVVLEMKLGEEEVQKTYKALVWISEKVTLEMLELLNNQKELIVQQQTPLRVAHRRANLTREKIVHWMKAKEVESDEHYLLLELCTSAGCYIKEFIHGDFGRSQPSIAELLQLSKAQCFALDVLDIGSNQEPNQSYKKSKQEHNC